LTVDWMPTCGRKIACFAFLSWGIQQFSIGQGGAGEATWPAMASVMLVHGDPT